MATGEWTPVPAPAPERAPDSLRRGGSTVPWHILFGLGLAALAVVFLEGVWQGAVLLFSPDSTAADSIRSSAEGLGKGAMWLNVGFSFLLFAVIPFAWVLGTRVRPWRGTLRYLQMERPWPALGKGLLLAIPLVVGVLLLSLAYLALTEGADGLREAFSAEGGEGANPAVEAIVRNLDPVLLVAIALAAGVGEEVFFRGILQKRVGVWGQAGLFALFHASGGYVPQLVAAFAMGLLFGHLVKRGSSLWLVIAAHAGYDAILLSTALLGS